MSDGKWMNAKGWVATVYKDAAGKWRWTAKAANGEITGASSEGYSNKSDCIANLKAFNFWRA